jgi:hypothetical protein
MQRDPVLRALKRAVLVIATIIGLIVTAIGVPRAANAAPIPGPVIQIHPAFTWSLAQMTQGNIVNDPSPNPTYFFTEQPTSPVTLNACSASGLNPATTYHWTFSTWGPPIDTPYCSTTVQRPVSHSQMVETVTLTTTSSIRLFPPSSSTQAIPYRDVVIASLGDSFASGEGAEGTGPGGTLPWLNPDCHRSQIAASAQAAAKVQRTLGSGVTVHFWFLACTGAQISDLMGGKYKGYPPQLDRLTTLINQSGLSPDRLVLSIGANDTHWSEAAQTCGALATTFLGVYLWDPMLAQDACVNSWAPVISSYLSNLGGTFTILQNSMSHLAVKDPSLAVNASNVYLTEYADPLDSENLPGTCAEPVAGLYLRSFAATVFQNLQTDVRTAAVNGGWHLVGGIGNAFQGHGMCQLAPAPLGRWVNTVADSNATQGDSQGTAHPNAEGQGQVANYVYNAISPGL